MMLPPWLGQTWRSLAAALAAQRLHHGLLVSAPEGFGKRALVDALAAAALCERRNTDGFACGGCRACGLVAAGSHPDLVRVGLELRDDGKQRSEITVDQVRALALRLAMSSQFGGLQLALVDPADRLNVNAANALLKTLEEPASSTVIVLVADEPARLPATIRSRCQRIDLRAPTQEEAIGWLRANAVDEGAARAALQASLGNPGRALEWSAGDMLEVRRGCLDDLLALAAGSRGALDIAERWAADRPAQRLWFASVHARDEARTLARGSQGAAGLTARGEIPKLAAWAGQVDRVRALLATTVRIDLLLLDLLRGWPARERR